MNYWEEKDRFWDNKTKDNAIYESKDREIMADVIKIIRKEKIEQVIDVCGYKGGLEKLLRFFGFTGKYINLDFNSQFDVTIPWDIQKKIDNFEKTLSISSLALICLPPESIISVIREINIHAKYQYYLDQKFDARLEHKQQLSDDYGGKWNYNWLALFPDLIRGPDHSKIEESKVNMGWVKFYREI